MKVARHKNQEIIGAGVLGDTGLGQDVAGAVARGAHCDDEVWSAETHGDIAGELEEAGLVLGGEGDGLAVCACDDDWCC